jgi:hypothetical protein
MLIEVPFASYQDLNAPKYAIFSVCYLAVVRLQRSILDHHVVLLSCPQNQFYDRSPLATDRTTFPFPETSQRMLDQLSNRSEGGHGQLSDRYRLSNARALIRLPLSCPDFSSITQLLTSGRCFSLSFCIIFLCLAFLSIYVTR